MLVNGHCHSKLIRQMNVNLGQQAILNHAVTLLPLQNYPDLD